MGTKLQTSNFKLQKLIVFALLTLGLVFCLTAAAEAVLTPVKSVVNPMNQTAYVINNGATSAKLHIYRNVNGSSWSINNSFTIQTGYKCYGLAVTPDGTQLLLSLSNTGQSKLRVFELDADGLPTTSTDATGWTPAAYSAPQGVAVNPAGAFAYLVDAGSKQIHLFFQDPDTKGWSYAVSTNSVAKMNGIFDVAVSANKLFVTKKTSPEGTVFVYNLFIGIPPVTPNSSIEGLSAQSPTQLKVSPDGTRLYVAVNGTGSQDIYVYDISGNPPYTNPKKIANPYGVTGAFGWTAFDLSPDGTTLFYTHAQDKYEAQTRLYRVNNLPLTVDTIATHMTNVASSDGVIVSPSQTLVVVSSSGNGSLAPNDGSGNYGLDTGLGQLLPVIDNISVNSCTTETGSVDITVTGKYFNSSSMVAIYRDLAPTANEYATFQNSQIISPNQIRVTLTNSMINNYLLMWKYIHIDPMSQKFGFRVKNQPYSQDIVALLPDSFELIDPPKAPNNPASFTQAGSKYANGASATVFPIGGNTDSPYLVFTIKMTDPNYSMDKPTKLKPYVKIAKVGFRGAGTIYSGNYVDYSSIWSVNPVDGIVIVPAPEKGDYTWQAMVSEESGLSSAWVNPDPSKPVHFTIGQVTTSDSTVPQDLMVVKNGNDGILTWTSPQAGKPSTGYNVYRSDNNPTNMVKVTLTPVPPSTETWTDPDAVSTTVSYYYIVKAVSGATESAPSNMGYLLKSNYVPIETAVSNSYWVSIPYKTTYKKARDIANDINGNKTPGDPGTCVEVGKFIPATGLSEMLTWYGDAWYDETTSDDQGFELVTGESYYAAIAGTTDWFAAGADNLSYAFNLSPDGKVSNLFWISLPYNSDYAKAKDIVDDINKDLTGDNFIVNEIGTYDPNSGITETLTWYGDAWFDTTTSDEQGFSFIPGKGYYISLAKPLTNWSPRRKQ